MSDVRVDEASELAANLTKKEAKELLQKYREDNTRCPELVRDIWLKNDLTSYLGDEKWPVLEQVCLAAIDLNDIYLMKQCLTQLESNFSNSYRVRRLKVMAKLELRERYDEAVKVYDEMIKKDESNSIIYKRKISILIGQRKIFEAVKELTEYLKKFMNDTEAWLELCDLYIQEQDYYKAAFCMEELILSSPHNHMYHEKYAEIQYTINTPESLELSRAYFSQALKLNPQNMRALYGLYLAASNLATQPKYSSHKRKENVKMASWALTQISKLYKEELDGKVDSDVNQIEGLMSNLQVNSV